MTLYTRFDTGKVLPCRHIGCFHFTPLMCRFRSCEEMLDWRDATFCGWVASSWTIRILL